MKTKLEILSGEFKKLRWVYRNDALPPIGEFNDLKFTYKFLMMVNPLREKN